MSDNPNRWRVVLDTNQIVSAGTRWLDHGRPIPDGNVNRRVVLHVAEAHTGLYCGKIIGEYLEKLIDLNHPPLRAQKFIEYLMGSFSRVPITSAQAPFQPVDPDDEIFLLCALDGQAEYLVSDDHALLELKPKYSCPVICSGSDAAVHLGA